MQKDISKEEIDVVRRVMSKINENINHELGE